MIYVAKIGKTLGVKGGLRLHLSTDFPEIFNQDIVFFAKRERGDLISLKIKDYHNHIVVFKGYEDLESAKTLTNMLLYTSLEDTRKYCHIDNNEAFWFDVIGCEIIENEELLGRVREIERIAGIDYLIIEAQTKGEKLPKSFMLPYIDRYILQACFKEKKIFAQGAKEIWLAS